MTTFIVIVYSAIGIVCIVFAWDTVRSYQTATGSVFDRLSAAFKDSLTIAWARLNALSVALIAAVAYGGDLLGAPGIKEALAPLLTPQMLIAYGVVVALGAEFSRRRSLAK